MKLLKAEKIETNRYELQIAVERDEWAKALQQSFEQNAPKVSVPGFRKGKAPRAIIEKMYGKGFFYRDAIDNTYGAAYAAAVKEAGISPVDNPEIAEIEEVTDDGYNFVAKVYVKPTVELSNYKGIALEKEAPEVTDEEIAAELDKKRKQNARILEVTDRAAQSGDIADIDFEGFVDGVAFEGGTAKNFELTLGSGTFIPGFEEQIAGHNIGESFEVNVDFPADYGAEQLAGKAAVFKVTLHGLKFSELPELDDEFAKDISEFDTLDELKKDTGAHLLEAKQKHADDHFENDLIDVVVDNLKGEIPDCMFERAVDDMMNDFGYRLQSQGMKIDDYMKYTGMDVSAMRKTFRAQAERQVKIRLALEKIVELENITPTDEQLEEEYKKLAENYKIEPERVKEAFPAEEIGREISMNKAIDLVRDSAKVTLVKEHKAHAHDHDHDHDHGHDHGEAENAEPRA